MRELTNKQICHVVLTNHLEICHINKELTCHCFNRSHRQCWHSFDRMTLHHTLHQFNGHFSRTTWVSRHQKGITNLDLLQQETVSNSGISWAICKSAPWPRQMTMPAPTTQFLEAGCPSCRPTNSVKDTEGTQSTEAISCWYLLLVMDDSEISKPDSIRFLKKSRAILQSTSALPSD